MFVTPAKRLIATLISAIRFHAATENWYAGKPLFFYRPLAVLATVASEKCGLKSFLAGQEG